MNRRHFIQTAAALFCAPAIVKAENIMRINPDLVLPRSTGLELTDLIYDVTPTGTPLLLSPNIKEIVMDLVYSRHNGADGWRKDYLQNQNTLIAQYLEWDSHARR